ncbi:MAG TPA: ABC transporter substrate-binding protein [Candidatus Paceibacterota bacterium]
MKKYIYIVIAIVVIIAVCVSVNRVDKDTAVAERPIKIGAVISLSGPAAAFGEYAKSGMELAAKEINSKGGMKGRTVEIVFGDDKTDPKSAVSAFNKLSSVDGVDAYVGGLWDFMAQPLLPLALSSKTAFISPSQFRIEGAFDLNEQSFVMLTDFDKVISSLRPFLEKSDVKKIAVVHFASGFGREIAETIDSISQDLGKGKIIDEQYAAIGTNDFKTTIAKLKAANVDTVFLDMVDIDPITFLKRSKEMGFAPKFITYNGALDSFKQTDMQLAEGVFILDWEFAGPRFDKLYQDTYGRIASKSVSKAYDAVYILAEAIANTNSREDVAAYVESHSFETMNGTIRFLPTHAVETTDVLLKVVRAGKAMAI